MATARVFNQLTCFSLFAVVAYVSDKRHRVYSNVWKVAGLAALTLWKCLTHQEAQLHISMPVH